MHKAVFPPTPYIIAFLAESRALLRRKIGAPRDRLMMNQFRKWCKDIFVPAFAQTQAEINIVIRDREVDLVKATNLEKYDPAHYQAGGGHR